MEVAAAASRRLALVGRISWIDLVPPITEGGRPNDPADHANMVPPPLMSERVQKCSA
jgi:hypothetical protein